MRRCTRLQGSPHRAPAAARAGRRPTAAREEAVPPSKTAQSAPCRATGRHGRAGFDAYLNARPSTRRTGRMPRARRVRRRIGSMAATRAESETAAMQTCQLSPQLLISESTCMTACTKRSPGTRCRKDSTPLGAVSFQNKSVKKTLHSRLGRRGAHGICVAPQECSRESTRIKCFTRGASHVLGSPQGSSAQVEAQTCMLPCSCARLGEHGLPADLRHVCLHHDGQHAAGHE